MESDSQVQCIIDPETEFLASKRKTGNEWELFKENVRPLKRGRNVNLLNEALKSQVDNHFRKSLHEKRRKLIEAIEGYKGEDPLQPWLDCIKWVQESFPAGGDCSGLILIYEQCVRSFWHSERYKDDLRYLKVWLEYAENCTDAEVIYNFLDANDIGKPHSTFYISYALHMESKNKIKAANEILNRGISRNAQPIKKLEDAYRKFLARSMARPKAVEEETVENHQPARSFGTLLARGDNTRHGAESSELVKRKQKGDRAPLAIYKDTNVDASLGSDTSKKGLNSWHTLGPRAERNKENNAVPAKWTSHKIPQRPAHRTTTAAPSAVIEVFVDEDCAETAKSGERSPSLQLSLRNVDGKELKKETELLRENPLRNFPPNSLPR